MTKKINLLTSHEDRSLLQKRILLLKSITIVLSIISLIFFSLVLSISYSQKSNIQSRVAEKEIIMKSLVLTAEKEKKFERLDRYYNELKKLINSDINFLPYYRVLTDSLNESTESAELSSVLIDNQKNVTMKLNFNSYDSMLSFTNALQSKEFLDKFSVLNVESFTLNEKNTSSYSLLIKGTFNPIAYSLL